RSLELRSAVEGSAHDRLQQAVETVVLAAQHVDVVGELLLLPHHAEQTHLFGAGVWAQQAGHDLACLTHPAGVPSLGRADHQTGCVDDLVVLGHEATDDGDGLATTVGTHGVLLRSVRGWGRRYPAGRRPARQWVRVSRSVHHSRPDTRYSVSIAPFSRSAIWASSGLGS